MMTTLSIQMTSPIPCDDAAVCFSAYAAGWGYRAFRLPYEVVCERLGAGDTSEQQIRLAFQSGKQRILDAVEGYGMSSYSGERISLSPEAL
ncbi:hypothetical protein [Paraburkholderia humisilvae]|uniref:DUF1488 domain-containing protein n=1 Tax=Paraburkholderia humisilvae TaxID=627669 RepID=A0A6J5FCK4_9BURK|nr:hypothetical protein [Paraburkholderia humisilvae]CAB3774955.1 hypothetical protein LMG29542_08337 [Paraburkholderia humisilvae]